MKKLTKFELLLSYFLPHPHTHQKAHLLHWHFLIIYILLFILLRVGIDLVNIYQPGVLGVTSEITIAQIIEDTNKERAKKGLSVLKENQSLNKAAYAKAINMFEEDYWAHFAPSGKDPWGFIKATGYKFSYAGENLAKNFQKSDDVVVAWMNSPTHRDNLLSSHYQEIGIAVVDGVLQGQQTTLVVQMFGAPIDYVASVPAAAVLSPAPQIINTSDQSQVLFAGKNNQISQESISLLINPYDLTKNFSFILMAFLVLLLVADFVVLQRRGVFRFSSHHAAHLSLLSISGFSVFLTKAGEIL